MVASFREQPLTEKKRKEKIDEANKLIEFNAPKPVFEKNKRFQLDVEEVVNHVGKEDVPSFVPKETKPKRPTYSKNDRHSYFITFHAK